MSKNPQQHIFLNAHMSGDTSSPGVGTDLVYRDPWGNPYVITMDLNYDESVRRLRFTESPTVSAGGLNGLVPSAGRQLRLPRHGHGLVRRAGRKH